MKLTIESTDKFITTDEGEFRLWIGTTEKGHQCMVLAGRIAPGPECEAAEFSDLQKVPVGTGMVSERSMHDLISTGLCNASQFTKVDPQDVFASMIAKAMQGLPEEGSDPKPE